MYSCAIPWTGGHESLPVGGAARAAYDSWWHEHKAHILLLECGMESTKWHGSAENAGAAPPQPRSDCDDFIQGHTTYPEELDTCPTLLPDFMECSPQSNVARVGR